MTTWFYPGQEDYIAKLNDLAAIAALSTGPAGWSPRFGLVSDGERRVLQVQDWIGGGGTKPATGAYVGNTSYVSDISSAVDIRGSIGPSGLNGTDGVDGEPGPANELSIGTVTAGLTADASITGISPSQVLNLVLPKGDKGDTGDKGDKGDKGDANVLSIGTVVSGETASASITGTSPAQVLNLVLPKGDKGDKGDAGTNGTDGTDGVDGAAATITVGTVTTGAPGTSVQVTNSGTTNAAVFDFVIPKGDPGDGSGDVTGPASSTDNAFVVFDGTGGNVIKQGPAVVAAGATEEDARVAVKVDSSYSFRMSEVDRAAYIDDFGGLLPELTIGYSNGNLILFDAEIGAPIQVDYVPWAGITNKPAVIAAGADAAAARYAISAAASTHSHSTSDVTGLGTELAALNDHIAGTGEFHAASVIQVTPVGGIAADNVQAALAELDSEKLADAPSNGVLHGRKDGAWVAVPEAGDVTLNGAQTLANKTIHGNANTITVDGVNAVGFRHIPQNSQSVAYTLTLDDAGKHILHPAADTAARTFTIPANSAVAFPIGTAITFINQNGTGGVVTISITTDTMRLAGAGTTGSRTLARNGVATAIKITSTEWIISGTGLT